ncbi:MAG: tRNA (adenosine(37)-N6)-threonylcarbamoyltransferase complex dimerization subunit type 1 TsaB [Lachnospiraceae bacterium]|jgi:tRNA threonylcarbamoyladenosine biosynthesis protein TsaB|nr:tRNA (adenosine(37)-N6)-threonylcarbamoyltransferase complex dimerization subunit type 1 TsaB [Lachnospiraceae bacterium]
MKILAIDSSGMPASAAVVEDGKLIAAYTVNYQKTHSQTLLPMIDELSRAIELDKTTLGAVAVSGGPGSFTGLRIGSATAKGIALALKIPIINVPTLEGLASNFHGCSELICPMMDARRTEVFAGVYTYQDDCLSVSSDKTSLDVLMDQQPVSVEKLCIKLNEMAEKTGKRLILLGDGCVKYRDILNEKLTVPYKIAPLNLLEQSAASVALRAEELLAAGRTETAEEHRPIYLRVSQAERVRSSRLAEKSPIRIRPAEEKDLSRIAVMEKLYFSLPWSEKMLRESLHQAQYTMLVAENCADGEIAGYVILLNAAGEGNIMNIAVSDALRRQGIAGKLLTEVMHRGREEGICDYTLEVRKSNKAAVTLYEGLGFRTEGVRKDYYEQPREDALIMWKRKEN